MHRFLKIFLVIALAALTAVALSGCGKSAESAESAASPVPSDASLSFSAANLDSAVPAFWDGVWNGVPLQLLALSDGSGGVLLAYNTCQVCAGSPYAYFELQDGALVCQNCGNAFPVSSIGENAGDCNPMPVEQYRLENGQVILEKAELDRAAQAFAHWKEGLPE